MKSKSLFNSSKWRVGNPLFDELRAQKYVQIRKICPKFCIFNRRKSVENELFRCLIGAINRHFPTPKWPDLPCFLAKGSRKSFAGQISGRATVAPVKNDDFGGVFHPLAGKLFSVTKSISRCRIAKTYLYKSGLNSLSCFLTISSIREPFGTIS